MPDVAVHASFGKEVLASLPEEIRRYIVPEPYAFAQLGPDVWFLYQPWKRREGRGRRMHTTRTGRFLCALLRQAGASSCRRELFSYLAGFFCHYALDSTTHPYIIYVTEEEHVFPRSHMSLEHALDLAEIRRDGFDGESHPVTDHYYPAHRLPPVLQPDLDAVFEEVYGWKRSFSAMNRSCRRYRLCYRVMEHPRGFAARLTRLLRTDLLRSLIYSESQFLSLDPENAAHRTWRHPYDPSLTFSDSFPELREQARQYAVRLITAAFRHLQSGEGTEEELASLIGSRSYLSGLPEDDPRGSRVRSLLPPEGGKEAR